MAINRRVFASGALAVPLAAQLAGAGAASAQVGSQNLTVLQGLAELRMTDLAHERLVAEGIRMQAVAPATAIMGSDGTTVRGVALTPEYATGTITLTGQPGKGSGRVRGGVVLANSRASMEIAEIRGSAPGGEVFAFLKVDEQWIGELPVYYSDLSAMRLSVQPGTVVQPVTIKGNGIPFTLTRQGVAAFTEAFGVELFTTEDTIFTASVQGTAWPLPPATPRQRPPSHAR